LPGKKTHGLRSRLRGKRDARHRGGGEGVGEAAARWVWGDKLGSLQRQPIQRGWGQEETAVMNETAGNPDEAGGETVEGGGHPADKKVSGEGKCSS